MLMSAAARGKLYMGKGLSPSGKLWAALLEDEHS